MDKEKRVRSGRPPKVIPTFGSEEEERAFWAKEDTVDYIDEAAGPVALEWEGPPRDRHKAKGVLLRFDPVVIDRLKSVAKRKGIGYQTLIRMWVLEHLEREAS